MHDQKNKDRNYGKIISDLAVVVVVFVLILFALKECTAQSIGGNGAGFFENIDDTTTAQIANFDQPITIRVPGGAIAKFADPWTNTSGWGLSHPGVDSIQLTYGSTEEEASAEALQKWHNKVDMQPVGISYLDELIKLSQQLDLTVIWVANMFIPAENTVNAITYLKLSGVKIAAVEMGNETYSQLDYDFNAYMAKSAPIYNAIKSQFPDIPVSHIAAPFCKGRNEQENWNAQLNAWRLPGDLVTIHYYIGSRELPSIGNLPERKTADYNNPTFTLDQTFGSIYQELNAYDHCAISTAVNYFQDATLIITETNTQPAEPLGDTYLNAIYQFEFLNTNRENFAHICWHNFVAPDIYGMFSRIKKGENGLDMQARTTSYSFDIAGDMPAAAVKLTAGQTVDLSTPGEHWYYYKNAISAPYTVPVQVAGVSLDSVRQRFFSAPFLSSNAITTGTATGTEIPENATGYIVFYTSIAKTEILGCTDSTAFNYNPDANTEDGTCIARIYGCTNPVAYNYNPEANTDDNSCVIITIPCYKKRLIFRSLPCKPSKRVCNC